MSSKPTHRLRQTLQAASELSPEEARAKMLSRVQPLRPDRLSRQALFGHGAISELSPLPHLSKRAAGQYPVSRFGC